MDTSLSEGAVDNTQWWVYETDSTNCKKIRTKETCGRLCWLSMTLACRLKEAHVASNIAASCLAASSWRAIESWMDRGGKSPASFTWAATLSPLMLPGAWDSVAFERLFLFQSGFAFSVPLPPMRFLRSPLWHCSVRVAVLYQFYSTCFLHSEVVQVCGWIPSCGASRGNSLRYAADKCTVTSFQHCANGPPLSSSLSFPVTLISFFICIPLLLPPFPVALPRLMRQMCPTVPPTAVRPAVCMWGLIPALFHTSVCWGCEIQSPCETSLPRMP